MGEHGLAPWLMPAFLLTALSSHSVSPREPAESVAAGEMQSASTADAATPVPGQPAVAYLALLDFEPGARDGCLFAVELTSGTLRLLPSRELPSSSAAEGPGLLASHDGAGRLAVVEHGNAGWAVRVMSLRDGSSRRIAVKDRPAALVLTRRALLVGRRSAVDWIDLDAARPEPVELVSGSNMGEKAYDLFARDGELVVAIDDVVMPIVADSFRLGSDGVPRHLASFSMPGVVNGSYRHVVYLQAPGDRGTLFATASYGFMDGHGQDVVALPMLSGKPSVNVETPLNAARSIVPPVLEEHVARQSNRAARLAAGEQFTPFSGLAVARRSGSTHRLAVAAGQRGLLLLPLDFGPDSKATVIDLGAPVADVLAVGERLFALTPGALLELGWQGDALVTRAKVPVATKSGQFVR